MPKFVSAIPVEKDMDVIAIRLKPGEDLKQSLLRYCIDKKMTNLNDMRKKIDAMRLDREAWTVRMRQIDADREARKLNAKNLL